MCSRWDNISTVTFMIFFAYHYIVALGLSGWSYSSSSSKKKKYKKSANIWYSNGIQGQCQSKDSTSLGSIDKLTLTLIMCQQVISFHKNVKRYNKIIQNFKLGKTKHNYTICHDIVPYGRVTLRWCGKNFS